MLTVQVKLKKIGNRIDNFIIKDNYGNILSNNATKADLIKGMSFEVEDNISVIVVEYGGKNCCGKNIILPIQTLTKPEIVNIKVESKNTSTLWKHLTNSQLFNNFYGCIHPYILEYPYSYSFNDEIIQGFREYSKVYKYLSSNSDFNRKIQVDDVYYNKAIIYNDQQSSGTLELVAKPLRNMKALMSYPRFKSNSKEIIYTKTDNIYQFNTFWNVVKDPTQPLFVTSCENLYLDKEVNDSNLEYSSRSFRKDLIRGKDSKVRLILDNRSDTHIISQVSYTETQTSYK